MVKEACRSSYDDREDFNWISRSSHRRCSVGKGVLRNFVKFTVNHLCHSLHSTSVRPATLLKERLWHNWFPVNFAKFLRTTFWQNTSVRLLLNSCVSSQRMKKIFCINSHDNKIPLNETSYMAPVYNGPSFVIRLRPFVHLLHFFQIP